MRKVAYLGLDAHSRQCLLGGMNAKGTFLFSQRFRTSESDLISKVVAVRVRRKVLALEESPLAAWIGGLLRAYVDELIICDPRQNALISRCARKNDAIDAHNLCRLLRLGELKSVYRPEEDHGAIFKSVVQQYLDLRDQQTALKLKIEWKYRGAGVVEVDGKRVYGAGHRSAFLGNCHAKPRERRWCAFMPYWSVWSRHNNKPTNKCCSWGSGT